MTFAIALVGAEQEENLALRYLAAAVESTGFRAHIVPFAPGEAVGPAVDAVLSANPAIVGISLAFQAGARELLGLAARLRERGYDGLICVGGQFATLEHSRILEMHVGVDAVVLHEGEGPLVDLCRSVASDSWPAPLSGIARRASRGIDCAPPRALPPLDSLPLPDRRGQPNDILGVRSSPLVGSRGCYGDCSFCSIFAYHESARGPRYRSRSPESIVAEMRREYEERDVRIFVFHDDNFLLSDPQANLRRYGRMGELLARQGLDDIALSIKCRPNDVHAEVLQQLKSIGLVRVYVGIESDSDEGLVSLNRRVTHAENARALATLRDLDIFCSFNVLVFDPQATIAGLHQNLEFMENNCDIPFNFCRAEVYAGTPLKRLLEHEGRLRGNYLAWDYTMPTARMELIFRIASVAFDARNFTMHGVHCSNAAMRYENEVLRRFGDGAWNPRLHRQMVALSRRIGQDSVDHMRRIAEFVEAADPRDAAAIKEFALCTARAVARADLDLLTRIGRFRRHLRRRMSASPTPSGSAK